LLGKHILKSTAEVGSSQTKPQIALAQVRAAVETGVPRGVVLSDAGYGNEVDANGRSRPTCISGGAGHRLGRPHRDVLSQAGLRDQAVLLRDLVQLVDQVDNTAR
jgi:hypothetical protein